MTDTTKETRNTVLRTRGAAAAVGLLVVLLTAGPESETFLVWWGMIPTSILTIVLTIVVVVTASVLRAERAGLRGRRWLAAPGITFSGVLEPIWFERFLDEQRGDE